MQITFNGRLYKKEGTRWYIESRSKRWRPVFDMERLFMLRQLEKEKRKMADYQPIKVQIQRNRGGQNEEETADFVTMEEAIEWADTMRTHYGYRKIWINGTEYNKTN